MSVYGGNTLDAIRTLVLCKPGLASSYIAFDDLRDLTEVAGAIPYDHDLGLRSWLVGSTE